MSELSLLAFDLDGTLLDARVAAGGAVAGPPPLVPGMRAALSTLAARPETLAALVTGEPRRRLEPLLQAHGLAGLFVSIQTADAHPAKPNPAMLAAALAETGVAPARAAVIGDGEADMLMARALGVRALGVAWGRAPAARLRAAGAEAVAATPEALAPALAALGVIP